MTSSLSIGEQEESFFLSPQANLQQSLSSDGIKPIRPLHSTSSSLTLSNQPYRIRKLSSTNPNDVDSFISQFERRLDEHRIYWQKEYDRKIQQMIECKTNELQSIQGRYENQLKELQTINQQLEIHSGQINEENQRLKIEIEHGKQQIKIEQSSTEQHWRNFEHDMKEKIHQLKIFYENDKQELKRQQTRTHEDLLEETNQRLKKMENDYKYHQATNQTIMEEMEKRLGDLRTNIDHLQQTKDKLSNEKIHLIKNNEQLQIQLQELINKHHHSARDHTDVIQRYENEIKSVRLREESFQKENEFLKTKSNKIIEDLEKKLSIITEQVQQIQRLFDEKLSDQQIKYHHHLKQSANDYEAKLNEIHQNNEQQIIVKHQTEEKLRKTLENKETNKQKLVHKYEQFIQKLENEFSQKINDYETRMEILITKTHEQLRSMENDFETRNSKQQAMIIDQQKLIETLKDEQIQSKISHEQTTREKNQIKEQFDICMKNAEQNLQTLTTKKEQLERKLSYLIEEHQHEMIECRLSYEQNIQGLLTNDVRLDFETTIHSLKQQVIYLQQRIALLQQELEQYTRIYGHRIE